jgi:type IV secretory pathway VirB4 component
VSNIILDQCKTHFLFPNVNCKRETLDQYKHTFNLTDAETAFVSGEHPQAKRKPYSVLFKKPTESVILDCDLRSLGNYLKVYKSGTECVARVNQLQQQETTWLDTYLS